MHIENNFCLRKRVLTAMKRLLFTLALLWSIAFAQEKQAAVLQYISLYHNLAVQEQWRTGVPAAIKMAQAILESGAGSGDLAQRSNNHFGIKCKSNWTGATVYHDDDLRGECFRAYPSVLESFRDHSDFLRNNQRYAFLFDLDPSDFEGWAWGLKKAGYATNPVYSQRIIKLIQTYELNQYTDLALQTQPGTPGWTVKNTMAIEKEPAPVAPPKTVVAKTQVAASPETVAIDYPNGAFKQNGLKVIYAQSGTSLLGLASTHKMSLADLLRFNDMPQQTILEHSQLIFLEKKMKKRDNVTYTCNGGETPWLVSQKLGVQLKELLKLNAIRESSVLASGTILKAG